MTEAPYEAPSTTGKYDLVELIGRGGMGEVHSAIDSESGEHVAVKLVPSAGYPDVSSRFLSREITALSRLDHENVVGFIDSGLCLDDSPFLVMERLDGKSLLDLMDEYGALPWEAVKPIMIQLCNALQAVHEENMVHGDVKPENIFLSEIGNATYVKLLDFGLVRFTDDEHNDMGRAEEGVALGTPDYMSPEQISSKTCNSFDHKVDLHAVGILMYELLTGARPFFDPNSAPVEIMISVLNDTPAAPSTIVPTISSETDSVIMRALEKDPRERFNNAKEMGDAIASCE
jgi:serine/threonine-protein kinase